MFKDVVQQLKTAFLLLLALTIVTGLIYPLAVTGIAQVFFPWQANGSIIESGGKKIGSQLIGQSFNAPGYFWGRPSATSPYPYNSASSSGSNMGPSNPAFLATVQTRVGRFTQFDPLSPVPVDLVTASGSGLDPEISPLAAYYQVARIANVRQLSKQVIDQLIQNQTKHRTFGILGEPRVNVLQLNLALDSLGVSNGRAS